MEIKTAKLLRKDQDTKIKDWEEEMERIARIFSAGMDGRVLSRNIRVNLNQRIEFLADLVAEANFKCIAFDLKEREGKKELKLRV